MKVSIIFIYLFYNFVLSTLVYNIMVWGNFAIILYVYLWYVDMAQYIMKNFGPRRTLYTGRQGSIFCHRHAFPLFRHYPSSFPSSFRFAFRDCRVCQLCLPGPVFALWICSSRWQAIDHQYLPSGHVLKEKSSRPERLKHALGRFWVDFAYPSVI